MGAVAAPAAGNDPSAISATTVSRDGGALTVGFGAADGAGSKSSARVGRTAGKFGTGASSAPGRNKWSGVEQMVW
jgi:hypothetical protein